METIYFNMSELLECSPSDENAHLLANLSAEYEEDCYRSSTLQLVSTTSLFCLLFLYSCTSLTALLGNLLVIIVQVLGNESAKSVRHHLISLAIADLISGVLCVPFTYTNYLLRHWIFPPWLCPTAQYAQLLSVFINSSTLTIIGIERYIATVHPFSAVHRWLRGHTKVLLTATWILGSAYAYLPFSHTRTSQFTFENTTYLSCTYDNELSHAKRRLFLYFNFILTFLIPSITLTASYAAIWKTMKRQKRRNGYFNDGKHFTNTINHCGQRIKIKNRSKRMSNRLKAIQLLAMLIILYDICWFPIKLYQFLIDFDLVTFCSELKFNFLIATYVTCHWLAMANSAVNPIVYSFMSKSFRNDLQKIRVVFCKKGHSPTKCIAPKGKTGNRAVML